jgi:AP2-like factor, euAP2 lineage
MELNIKGYVTIIDDEDYDLIKEYSWRVCTKEEKQGLIYFHAATKRDPVTRAQKDIRLHRFIMKCSTGDGIYIDHINHNTLDNRKCNLRKTDAGGNVRNSRKTIRNTSGYKGVSFFKRDSIYKACIKYKGVSYNIGGTPDIIEAAKLYDMMAIKLFGEYACINFNVDDYQKDEIEQVYKRMMDNLYSSNTSGYRGVSWNNEHLAWSANIQCNKKNYYLGFFNDPIEAAKVRDRKAVELFGAKAILNFPMEEYTKEQKNEQETAK